MIGEPMKRILLKSKEAHYGDNTEIDEIQLSGKT
jgi:hypothetical protein